MKLEDAYIGKEEVICIKGITFKRAYFHSCTLIRPTEAANEKYVGKLCIALNLLIPNIYANQGILKTMFIKEDFPVNTLHLYCRLLENLSVAAHQLPDEIVLTAEHLTEDEKLTIRNK